MITQTFSDKHHPALTSNRWHVVHARWSGAADGRQRFVRQIVSEHDDRSSANASAQELVSRLAPEMVQRPRAERDQLFVRKPGFRSLQSAGRVRRRR